jgi:hypothetical protein
LQSQTDLRSELIYSKNGERAFFLLRLELNSENTDRYYSYRQNLVEIENVQNCESIYTYVSSYNYRKGYKYKIFAWGQIVGEPSEFIKRFIFLEDKKEIRIVPDKVCENNLPLFVCANAETGGRLAKIPAFKRFLADIEINQKDWNPLIEYLIPDFRGRSSRQGKNLDLYSVFTGVSAIRETLQTDINIDYGNLDIVTNCHYNVRALQGAVEKYNEKHENPMNKLDIQLLYSEGYLFHPGDCPEKGKYYLTDKGRVRCPLHGNPDNPRPDPGQTPEELVSVASIKGPAAPSHDWKSMLKDSQRQLPEIYKVLPADCAFVHFPSYKSFRTAFDYLDDWASSFGTAFGGDFGNSDFGLEQKIKNQLLLKTDILTRLFADMALSDIVFLCEDPFVFEGSAFAVILKIENETLLKQKLAMTAAEFCKDNPQIKKKTLEISGRKVQAFVSPKNKFSSYQLRANGFQIVCNSSVLMQKIINVLGHKEQAMTDNHDLHYFYEHIESNFVKEGRIFTFLSDAFIRKLIGPAYKIASKRRLECLRNILLQNYELLINGKLNPEIECPEGGEYKFVKGQVTCSRHNKFGFLKPLSENLPAKVKKGEAESYGRFVKEYNQYFSQFFDPIGLVFVTEPDFKARILIMPLVEKGVYSELQQNVKTEAMRPGPGLKNGIVKLGANLKVEKMLPLAWNRSPQGRRKAGLIRRCFTGCIWIHMADHPLLLHFDSNLLARGILGSLGGRARPGFDPTTLVPAVLSFISPVMFAFELTSEDHYQEIIKQLQNEIEQNSHRIRMFMAPDIKLEKLLDNGHEMHVFSIDLFGIKKTFYFTCYDGFFLISSKKQLFYQLEKSDKTKMLSGNFNLFFYPENVKLMRSDLLEIRARSERNACLENLRKIHLIKIFRPDETEKYYKLLFGAKPNCPAKGKYNFKYPISCSTHAGIANGVIKTMPDFLKDIELIAVQSYIDNDGFQSEISIEKNSN